MAVESDHVKRLKDICYRLDEKEPEIDKNFYAINMHGTELADNYIIPKGIRIIMFCYSGRILKICPRFDTFNWSEIFLNEDSSYNYCTFLSNLVQYSTLRDHFCVYNSGDIIKDIIFHSDEVFRDGIYRLPVYAAVTDPADGTTYVSSSEIFTKAIERFKSHKTVVDPKRVGKILRHKESNAIIFSKHIFHSGTKLSTLIRDIQYQQKEFTMLILTCRKSKGFELPHTRRVYEELNRLYQEYQVQRTTLNPPKMSFQKQEKTSNCYIFDVDGTLKDLGAEISDDMANELVRLQKEGHMIVIASGNILKNIDKFVIQPFIKHGGKQEDLIIIESTIVMRRYQNEQWKVQNIYGMKHTEKIKEILNKYIIDGKTKLEIRNVEGHAVCISLFNETRDLKLETIYKKYGTIADVIKEINTVLSGLDGCEDVVARIASDYMIDIGPYTKRNGLNAVFEFFEKNNITFRQIIYFGDNFSYDGNDFPVTQCSEIDIIYNVGKMQLVQIEGKQCINTYIYGPVATLDILKKS